MCSDTIIIALMIALEKCFVIGVVEGPILSNSLAPFLKVTTNAIKKTFRSIKKKKR